MGSTSDQPKKSTETSNTKEMRYLNRYGHGCSLRLSDNYFELALAIVTLITNTEKEHYVPKQWPIPQRQHGGTCGFYALNIALQFYAANMENPPIIPPATTEDERELSLFQIAKKRNLSTIGEILDTSHFATITRTLGITGCHATFCDPNNFISSLCVTLDLGHTAITSCDLSPNSFPGINNGEHAHWILIFGYFDLKKPASFDEKHEKYAFAEGLHFLVTHHNHYALWPAEKLLASNSQNPNQIYPKCASFGYFCDDQFYKHNDERPTPTDPVTIPDQTLERFYCSFFSVPGLKPSIPHIQYLESAESNSPRSLT